MKAFHNSSHFMSSVCSKISLLFLYVFVMQNVAAAQVIRSFDFQGNETDRSALLAIKSQLNDPNGGLSSWNNSVHHCHWEGVTCWHKYNRVTRLDLSSRNLSGTISPFIGNLTFLNTVYLYNNNLYGNIPSHLGKLSRLQYLELSNNTLTGAIPANLSSCTNLVVLDMDHNNLEGKLPSGFSSLLELEELQVYSNKLKGPFFNIIQNLTSLQSIDATYNSFTGTIPNNIDRMQNLKLLQVGSNKFSGTLPASFFNISSFETLDLADNQFNGELPTHMGFSVSRLSWLDVSSNKFSGTIPNLTNFTNLESIALNQNSFTGRIATDFGQFYNLQYLDLGGNHLKGDINIIISTLINCTKLYILELGPNQLSGELTRSVANLSISLAYFSIGANSMISGEFPIGITKLINLQGLQMYNTKITSYIPHDIGKLQKLESLELDSNRLTGKIPDSWSNLSRLSTLYLDQNKLEGSIPQSIGKCQSLLDVDLSNNQLNGTLEDTLFTTSAKFFELSLAYNNLEGPLPFEISKQTSLVKLVLSHNKFKGVLPNGLSECTELQILFMENNSFHGDIPSSYASLTSLQVIDFAQNNLSGPIPAFLSRIPSIEYLDISYNDFQGKVPTNSVFANASAVSLKGNKRLCGGTLELHLPKCIEKEITERKKRKLPRVFKIIIPVISALVGALAMGIGVYMVMMACLRKKKTPPPTDYSVAGETLMKVSYDKLLKATDGFSAERLLGSGSFGSVFKGVLDGKTVAVKVLNLQHHDAYKSFMAECKALRNVRHRNLVGIITACSSIDFHRNDFRALVYEFMPCGSLDKWLNGTFGNLSLCQRLDVVIDVAHALNYLHHECEPPIVHCDIKPSNILLDQDMVAHVGDFGLTRFLTQPRHPNQSSTLGIMGTIGYAAPEYGIGSEASTAGDVYSYGIFLLELITGKSPTDNMFKEHSNLHMYAKQALDLPDQVLRIIDPRLEEENVTEKSDNRRAIQEALQRRLECIFSVITVGVSCSSHLPQDRLNIHDAISRLQSAKDVLWNARNRCNRPTKCSIE